MTKSLAQQTDRLKIDVCHLTSAHDRHDTRIFQKMCLSLQSNGYQVALVVADGQPNDRTSGIIILGLPKFTSRLLRMVFAPLMVFFAAKRTRARFFHFHDPELLWVGLLLKATTRAKVIYDAHEDLPATVFAKTYIPERLRKFVSHLSGLIEKSVSARLDAIVTATPYIRTQFLRKQIEAVDICNYPINQQMPSPAGLLKTVPARISYIGNVGVNRGILELVSALPLCRTNVRLDICGRFSEPKTEETARSHSGWRQVDFHGWVDSRTITDILLRSSAGLVTLKPTPNYLYSLPVKLFEYMRAGLPVIASDFEEWRKIVDVHECGVLVNPDQPKEIAKAIDWIVENKERAYKMGVNGKEAVDSQFNWSREEKKLIRLYEKLGKHVRVETSALYSE